jgi:hypothetical protein
MGTAWARHGMCELAFNSRGLYTPRQADRLILSPIFTNIRTDRQILAKKNFSMKFDKNISGEKLSTHK